MKLTTLLFVSIVDMADLQTITNIPAKQSNLTDRTRSGEFTPAGIGFAKAGYHAMVVDEAGS
jgi:hypothetical protein